MIENSLRYYCQISQQCFGNRQHFFNLFHIMFKEVKSQFNYQIVPTIKIKQITYLAVLKNDDLVFINFIAPSSFVYYYNKKNNQHKLFKYEEKIQEILIINEIFFVCLLLKTNRIVTINFIKNTETFTAFQFNITYAGRYKPLWFSDSQTYVIYQDIGPAISKKWHVFKFPLEKSYEIDLKYGHSANIQSINKANKIGMFLPYVDDNIDFTVLNIFTKTFTKLKAKKPEHLKWVKINYVYEIRPEEYLLTCTSSQKSQSLNLIFDARTQQYQIRELKLMLPYKLQKMFMYSHLVLFIDGKNRKKVWGIHRQTEQLQYCYENEQEEERHEKIADSTEQDQIISYKIYDNNVITAIRQYFTIDQRYLYMYFLSRMGEFSTNQLHAIITALDYN